MLSMMEFTNIVPGIFFGLFFLEGGAGATPLGLETPDASPPDAGTLIETPDAGATPPDTLETPPDASIETPGACTLIETPDAGATPPDTLFETPPDAGATPPCAGSLIETPPGTKTLPSPSRFALASSRAKSSSRSPESDFQNIIQVIVQRK